MKEASQKNYVYVYELTSRKEYVEDLGEVLLYGIRIYNSIPEISLLEGESSRVDGISDNIDEVKNLCKILEEEKVFPVHLIDIIEDYLS